MSTDSNQNPRALARGVVNHCETCNASHKNTVDRVLRCMACVVRPRLPPTKWKPKDTEPAKSTKEKK